MTALPDPAELAPSQNPADYGRRRLFTASFWAMMSLCLLCVIAGAAVVRFAPMFQPKPQLTAAAAAPRQLGAPALAPVQVSSAPVVDAASDAVAARLDRLEGGQARAVDAAAGALAAASLSEAAAGPRPFAEDLAIAERILPPSADARALRPLAERGAPTRAALAVELSQAAANAAMEARRPARDAGFMRQLGYLVSRVISVRRVDGGGTGPDAAIAQAQRRAAEGDLEGAVAAIDTLTPAARDRLADWRARAERRLEIDRRVAGLRAQALADLAAVQRARP